MGSLVSSDMYHFSGFVIALTTVCPEEAKNLKGNLDLRKSSL